MPASFNCNIEKAINPNIINISMYTIMINSIFISSLVNICVLYHKFSKIK